MMKNRPLLVLALIISASACRSSGIYLTTDQGNQTYPISGEFTEPIAVVVIERDGKIDVASITGSAFLIDKRQGLFATAKHIVDLEVTYKVFFCGRVYQAERLLDPGVTDVGFLKLVGKFDYRDFPEPYKIALSVQKGEKIFMRGIHQHPPHLQNGKVLHRLISAYYGLKGGREFVYDDLPGTLVEETVITNSAVANKSDNNLAAVKQRDLVIKTSEDHRTHFAGLSGGPTVNEKGEVVGINSKELEIEGGLVIDENGLSYYPRLTLHLLPYDELRRAIVRLYRQNF